jgi:hypothetical protein
MPDTTNTRNTIYDLVTKQNYLSHNDIFWQQEEGLAMDAPHQPYDLQFS